MPNKRPSYVSVRKRQVNILEGIGTTNASYKEVAKRFGVKPHQVEKFVTLSPKQIRQRMNLSPAYRKLYEAGERKEVRERLGVKKIQHQIYDPRYAYIVSLRTMRAGIIPEEERAKRLRITTMVNRLYIPKVKPFHEWAAYTQEKQIPVSIRTIMFFYENGKISRNSLIDILGQWKKIYGVKEEVYETYMDKVEGEEE